MKIIKKGLLFGLVLILFSLSVYGAIIIDPFARDIFNYGDKLVVSGAVKLNQDARAFLTLSLDCGDSSRVLSTGFMDLRKDVETSFSQLVSLPGVSGICRIKAIVKEGSNTLDVKESTEIRITSDLKGGFDLLVKSSSQLGDSLSLTGAVIRYDNTGIDGSAIINFKQADNVVFFETVDIKGGELAYKKDLSLIPAGAYTIDVEAKDNSGNFNYFVDVGSFEVSDKIGIDVKTDKSLYNPGEQVILNGNIKSFTDSLLESVEIEASIEGVKLNDVVPDAKFPFVLKYNIPSNMKRGEHTIKITAKDDKGNYGSTILKFSVKAVPTVLNFALNKSSVIPLENIVFKVVVLDQANDVIEDNIFVKLYNEKGEFEKSKIVGTNGYDFLITPDMALPGNWMIKADGLGLLNEKTLVVLPYKKVVVDVMEGRLFVKNIGNVVYEDFIDVKAGDNIKGKKIYLDLNESTSIELDDLFEPGVYELNIPATGQNFSSVTVYEQGGLFSGLAGITGNAIANLENPGKKVWLFGLFLVLLVALIFVLKPGRKREIYTDSDRARDYAAGQRKLAELQAKGIRKGPSMQFGKADERDVADFRDRMARQVQDEERRHAKEDFANRLGDNRGSSGSGGGLINW